MFTHTKIFIGILAIYLFPAPMVLAKTTNSTAEDGSWVVNSNEQVPVDLNVAPAPEESATTTPEINQNEPIIRVGLYKTKSTVKFSSPSAYTIYSGEEIKGVLPAEEMAAVSYSRGTYTFKSKSVSFKSSEYLRLVPNDPMDYFTILGYQRHMPGRKTNYNSYRGTLEYIFSPRSNEPYSINELPMEEYMAGLGEASDGAAPEYLKALAVAGRTYAYVMIAPRSPKHFFDVFASTIDQLYLGYNSEIAMPHVAAAAAATAGIMVTYNGSPVITNYFAHSNGLTKTWDGRGFGSRPWLESVETPYDVGKKMSGHGYGMSCYDADMRAEKDGWSFDSLLAYYYMHTEIQKMY